MSFDYMNWNIKKGSAEKQMNKVVRNTLVAYSYILCDHVYILTRVYVGKHITDYGAAVSGYTPPITGYS